MRDRQTYEAGLRRALERLSGVGDANDEREVWYFTAEALTALYRFEEFKRKADPQYYTRRDSHPDGRMLAALIWFRAAVDHDGHDVREAILEWRPLMHEGSVLVHEGRPLAIKAQGWAWPRCPTGRDDPKHHRDDLYAEYVAGKPIMAPLQRAAAYLLHMA